MNSLLGGQPYNPQMMQLLGLDPAEMRQQALWQGLTQAGLGLLGMGPSRTPIGFGDYLAAGAQGGVEGAMAGKDAYLQNAVDAWQMQQMADDAAYKKTQQAQENTKFDAWQSDRQQAEDLRAGQQQASQGFLQDWQSQGGDLFPQWQGALRQQGVAGVDPSMSQTAQRMQPYMQAGDYGGAFGQMTAQGGDEAFTLSPGQTRFQGSTPIASLPDNGGSDNWETVTTNEGVFRINNRDPSQMVKVGDRPDRNEGEGREFTQEKQLRESYIKEAKPFTDLRTNYQRIAASAQDNTGASDIAMVYSFMKMLDPTSVVREGEFATAQNAGGVPSQIVAAYNRALSGERLAPEVRQQFMQQATRQYQQQLATYEQVRKTYQGLATQYGVNPERVTPDLSYGVQVDTGSIGVPDEAIRDLLADPSPEAMQEFNAVFGAGAAEAILQGR